MDEDAVGDLRNNKESKNQYMLRDYEYNEHDSVDSFDSKFADTDLGTIEVPIQNADDYLPKTRRRHELTIVPEDAIMKESRAPNWRMEPIEKRLQEEQLTGKNDEERMFELLE